MMSKLKCIIIDDNQPSIDLVKSYIDKLDFLEFQKEFTNPIDALNELDKLNPELIFLDMEMPQMSGLDFLKAKKPKQLVIVISDYKEYAIDTYEINSAYNIKIIDYLSKIITFPRFVASCEKAKSILEKEKQSNIDESIIFLKDNTSTFRIKLEDLIAFVPSEKHKPKIEAILLNQSGCITVRESLGDIAERLSNKGFIQINKSCIISLGKITEIVSKDLLRMDDGKEYTIGNHFQKSFFEKLKAYEVLGRKF